MNLSHFVDPKSWRKAWYNFGSRNGLASRRVIVLLIILLLGAIVGMIAMRDGWKVTSRRMAAGKNLDLDHYVTLGLWRAAQGAIVVSLLGLLTAGWWGRSCRPSKPSESDVLARGARWYFCLSLLVCVGLAAYFRAPRLNHGFWNDEEYVFRNYVWGSYTPVKESGALEFKRLSWKETLFGNEHGSNHVWSSVEARLGLQFFNHDGEGGVPVFHETAARVFPFVSGLLTVAAVGLLGLVLGSPRVGVLAALLLALSPWHIRYSVEIRGYSSMLLGVCGALICMVRALQTSRWRWWLGFAGFQAMFLLCFAGAVYVAIGSNLAALLVILTGKDRFTNFSRLVLVNLLSLVLFFSIFAPSVPQLLDYLKRTAGKNDYPPISLGWMRDLWAHLSAGVFYSEVETVGALGTSLEQFREKIPWAYWGLVVVLPALLGFGAFRMMKDWRSRFVFLALVGAAAFSMLHNGLKGNPMLGWYLLYLLPVFVLALAWPAHSDRKVGVPYFSLVIGVGYMVLTQLPRELLGRVPRQTVRETVQFVRDTAPALTNDPGPMTATFGTSDRQCLSYDPRVKIVQTPGDLEKLMGEAKAAKRELFVFYCGQARAREKDPELVGLTKQGSFERIGEFPAMEQLYSYVVLKFMPENWNH